MAPIFPDKNLLKEVYPSEEGIDIFDQLPEVGPGEYEPPEAEDQTTELQVLPSLDQEVVSMVVDRKMASENFRKDKKIIWDKCWDHMLQVYDTTGKEAWQSHVFWPDSPKVVETIVANLHSALLTPNVPLEWQVKVKAAEQSVRDTNDLISNDVSQGKFKYKFTDNLRELAILGTTVGKVEYDLCEDEVMVKERRRIGLMERSISEYSGQPLNEFDHDYSKKKFTVRDWAKVDYVDLYKIFPEPYSTEIDKDHWIIEESRISNAKLIELANHPDEFYRLENVTDELLMSGGWDESQNSETAIKRNAMNQRDVAMDHYDPDRTHQLLEYWGPAPCWMVEPEEKDNPEYKYKSVNAWFWVIDGKYLVRKRPNPYRDSEPPYFKIPYIKIPGDWYGIGPVELILHLQIEKNELINTAIDNINIMLNKIIAILKDKVPADCWNRLVSAPGKLWLFENTDDIRRVMMPVEFNNLLRDIYMAIDMVDKAMQEVSSATSATVGVGGGKDEAGGGTFRGQMLNTQMAQGRFMLYAKTMEFGPMGDMWRKLYHRIYQYKSYENVAKILGEERFKNFEFIPPEQLDEVAELVPLGVMTMESKGVKLAQMDQFSKAWAGRPWLKEYDLARREWIEMGYTDPDSVIFSEEEMQTFNNFRKQAMGEMPGMGLPDASGMPSNRPEMALESTNQPIAGNVPPPMNGMPREAMEARGPGASPIDMSGIPLG